MIINKSDCIKATSLGNQQFKRDYNLKYAYLTGSMFRGIASAEMVVKMGKAGMMGFLGTGGLHPGRIEEAIRFIGKELSDGQSFGVNLLHSNNPDVEHKAVDLYIKHAVKNIEASAFLGITPALVRFRAHGLARDREGRVRPAVRVIAKISRPEVAREFLSPAPDYIVSNLLEENAITAEQGILLKEVPMADDLCVEADSGGHTDGGSASVLMPSIIRLRDAMSKKFGYNWPVRIGAAGGIGTPEAAAAAFVLGADFILTGSINQCTVEAGQSEAVKDMLQQIDVQDTDYAPAGDMFELGAKVQVLNKGVFFPARAKKLYDLYRRHNSLEEIDGTTKRQLEEKYFKRSLAEIFKEVQAYCPPDETERAMRSPKHKMALIFRWYFGYSARLALNGDPEHKVDYQVHCGPALGAFNQWIKGTHLENWRNRHVDEIAEKLMAATAELLNSRFLSFKLCQN